jgi:hypothetical protein
MTAPIVTHYDGTFIGDPEAYCSSLKWSSADLTTLVRHIDGGLAWRGQLWERIAELDASGINYTERMERVKFDRLTSAAERLTREAESRHYMRGPDAKFATAKRSGIIRAGKRVV